jgi:hypothetical protein
VFIGALGTAVFDERHRQQVAPHDEAAQ